jgi:hypothetical protein
MTFHTSAFSEEVLREPGDFSLVLGGPLFQLLRRSHLSGDAMELVRRRIIIPLLVWLPLLVLSALEGQALGGNVAVPFLARRGGSRLLSGGAAAVDRCRAGGAPTHALRGAAIPGTQLESPRVP